MTVNIDVQKYQIIEQIVALKDAHLLEQIAHLLQKKTSANGVNGISKEAIAPSIVPEQNLKKEQESEKDIDVMQYVKPIKEKTDLDVLLEDYETPNMTKIVGIIPNDEPLEEVLKNLK